MCLLFPSEFEIEVSAQLSRLSQRSLSFLHDGLDLFAGKGSAFLRFPWNSSENRLFPCPLPLFNFHLALCCHQLPQTDKQMQWLIVNVRCGHDDDHHYHHSALAGGPSRIVVWIQLHTPRLAPAALGSVWNYDFGKGQNPFITWTFQPSNLPTFRPSNLPTFPKRQCLETGESTKFFDTCVMAH